MKFTNSSVQITTSIAMARDISLAFDSFLPPSFLVVHYEELDVAE
jgi:hypothetical protein